jgi:hypothetical protein
MDKPKQKDQNPEKRKFSQEQYEMLKRCSDKKDMTEWNEWRKNNRNKDIELEDEKFDEWHLQGAFLNKGTFKIGGEKINFEGDVYLKGAKFRKTELQSTIFHNARLQNTRFANAHLEKTIFQGAYLQDANFYKAKLQCANFKWVLLNNATSFIEIEVDGDTDFSCTSLDGIRIDPKLKQFLEYNVRRKNWEGYYKDENVPFSKKMLSNDTQRKVINEILKFLIKKFWQISDYGRSTWKIMKAFIKLAIYFAIIYYLWGAVEFYLFNIKENPGIVSNLFVLEGKQETVSPWLVPFRSAYFSIVTMTTLGFGDMYANAHSFLKGLFGHTLLAIQVILGYVILGALITRFAVLFTAGGPARDFTDDK